MQTSFNEEHLLADYDVNGGRTRRRELLPGWVIVGCWLYMILGLLSAGAILLNVMNEIEYSRQGASDPFFVLKKFVIIIAQVLQGIAGFLLWTEKRAGAKMGIIAGWAAVLCTLYYVGHTLYTLRHFLDFTMIAAGFFVTILGIILPVIFLVKMIRIRKDWEMGASLQELQQ